MEWHNLIKHTRNVRNKFYQYHYYPNLHSNKFLLNTHYVADIVLGASNEKQTKKALL